MEEAKPNGWKKFLTGYPWFSAKDVTP